MYSCELDSDTGHLLLSAPPQPETQIQVHVYIQIQIHVSIQIQIGKGLYASGVGGGELDSDTGHLRLSAPPPRFSYNMNRVSSRTSTSAEENKLHRICTVCVFCISILCFVKYTCFVFEASCSPDVGLVWIGVATCQRSNTSTKYLNPPPLPLFSSAPSLVLPSALLLNTKQLQNRYTLHYFTYNVNLGVVHHRCWSNMFLKMQLALL